MRIQFSKKKIVWLSIVIILLLIVTILLYLYSKEREESSIEKYRDIFSECSEEIREEGKYFVCGALLETILSRNGKECFYFDFVTAEGSLIKKEICEDIKITNWDKKVLDLESGYKLPVKVFFGKEILVERMVDDEASLFLKTIDSKYFLDPIMTYERENLLLRGYVSVITEGGFGFVYLNDVEVKNVEIKEQKFFVNFSARIDGVREEFWVKTDKFTYMEQILEVEGYTNISMKKNLNMILSFIPAESNFEIENFSAYCQGGNSEKEAICFHSEELWATLSKVENVEDSLFEARNTGGLLEGFILTSIGENE